MATEPSGQRVDGGPSGRQGARTAARRPPPRRRRKARLVHRVVRRVDVWSVAKVAAAFAACGYVIGMISGYLLWRAADRVGTIDGIEGFLEDSGGYDGGFEILGGVVFSAAAVGYAIVCALFVAMAVLGAVLFNLISDLTGGIRMTAIDEDLIVTPARRPKPAPSSTPTSAAPAPSEPHAPSEPLAPTASPAPSPAPAGTPAAGPDEADASPRDPWKLPAPKETWTSPAPERRNGDTTSAAPAGGSDRDENGESIGLGSADRVV